MSRNEIAHAAAWLEDGDDFVRHPRRAAEDWLLGGKLKLAARRVPPRHERELDVGRRFGDDDARRARHASA